MVGGDFNLDLTMLNQQEFTQLVLMDYNKLDHRHKKIDYVLTSASLQSRKHSCEPIDVLEYIENSFLEEELPLGYYKAVLDHDPLFIDFTI